jgi:UDP-N-acetylmuramoylalanine-D-glutamate ligase/very-short-patch-repair endonuclease
MSEFAGKRVAVIGAGRSGVAAAGALTRRGAQVEVFDRKLHADLPFANALAELGVALHTGTDAPESLDGYDLVVVSPGLPPSHPIFALAEAAGVPVWGEIELGYRIARAPIIAITGTNGKTTTTLLIHHILRTMGLRAHLCGNIAGIDGEQTLTEAAERAAPDEWLVAEVSSFQLLHTHTFRPRIAVITNIRHDHLDYHGTWEAYALAKAKILANQTPDDWAVLNGEDAGVGWLVGLPSPPDPLSRTAGEGELELPSPPDPLSRTAGEGESGSALPREWGEGELELPSPPDPLSRYAGEGESRFAATPSPTLWERGQGGKGKKARFKHPDLRVSKRLIQMARELRKRATPPEQLLWELLRNRRLSGLKFRRQHPLGGFVADFYCAAAQLIIELDGAVHQEPTQQERDRVRQQVLQMYGIACLRFTNREVFQHTEQVLQRILQVAYQRIQAFEGLPSLPVSLSRIAGEGEGEAGGSPSPTSWERGQGGEGNLGSPLPPSGSGAGGEGNLGSPLPPSGLPLSHLVGEQGGEGDLGSPSPTSWERGQGGEGNLGSPLPPSGSGAGGEGNLGSPLPPSGSGAGGEGNLGSPSPTRWERGQGGEGNLGSPSPTSWERGQGGEGKRLFFTPSRPYVELSGKNLNIADLPKPALLGTHGLENALAAATVASILGCTPDQLREALASFAGVPHRMEFVGVWNSVRYINNSMCTNADALEKSLQATPKPCLVIAGGVDKNESIAQLAQSLARHAAQVLLIGRDGGAIGAALDALGYTHWQYIGDLARAVAEACRVAHAGDTVILAPGCASFDQFRNFADRGEQFKRLVREVHGCDSPTP